MKKIMLMCCLVFSIWLLYAGFNYYRESKVLKLSGLDVSRLSVELIYSHVRSINLGADSSDIFGYRLPSGLSAISMCGRIGYSEVANIELAKILKLPDIDRMEEKGCVHHEITEGGTSYMYVLLEEELFIKLQ